MELILEKLRAGEAGEHLLTAHLRLARESGPATLDVWHRSTAAPTTTLTDLVPAHTTSPTPWVSPRPGTET